MSATPTDRRYTSSHEWVRVDGPDLVVGITDHAQSELTDIVFVDLPKPGRTVRRGESVLVLESVKTVADVYAPADGTIGAVNESLKTTPGQVNQDPFGAGWIYRLTPAGPFDPQALLSAEQYDALVAGGPPPH
ncbi:MAG TPA: glycine cleavage system protein GcvH [Thermoplasmata archaeon]|nr:glycine cleavage system protein GcvH [Thermoplasmata archaeon]